MLRSAIGLGLLLVATPAWTQAHVTDWTLECPNGTHPKGAPPPQGTQWGCRTQGGKKQGPFYAWHKNGKLSERGFFDQDVLHGDYRSYYEDGKPKGEGTYVQGKFSGFWTRWHRNGVKQDEGTWKEDAPDGNWRLWHESGVLKGEGRFSKGKRVCAWTLWDESGQKKSENYEDDGTCTRWELLQFRAYWDGWVQSGGGNVFTVKFAWTPSWKWNSDLDLRAALSNTFLKDRQGSLLYALSYELLVGTSLFSSYRLDVEAGGGFQSWLGSGTYPVASANLGWMTPEAWPSLFKILRLDRLWAGYSTIFYSGHLTHEIRLGAGIRLF